MKFDVAKCHFMRVTALWALFTQTDSLRLGKLRPQFKSDYSNGEYSFGKRLVHGIIISTGSRVMTW